MKNPLANLPERLRRRVPTAMKALLEMENEMDRVFQTSSFWPEEVGSFDFSPACDFKDTGKEYVINFDIPGIKREDVKIEMENNRLTVSGERSVRRDEKEARYLLSESCSGYFMRSFSLPNLVDESRVDAQYADGVLTITVPKIEASKAKQIKIH
ncbi:MAG: Hsp20/alpha crystallin family protein [Bdellovibrionales bacterium]|nr:Hsp20/alpha crystallin family protein [Bdellovibrionales bacterium]